MTDSEATVPSFQQVQFNFGGKHVFVTGASRGIGLAVATGFCAAGAKVSILADDDSIFDVANRLARDYGTQVTGYRCDISDKQSVDNTLVELSPVDILVNNAGIEKATPIVSNDPTDSASVDDVFKRVIDVNVMGTYYITRALVARMPIASSIVFTCSIWSKTAVADYSAYCASKHAVLGFMRSLACELAPRNIRVNGVCPGWVKTQASMQSLEQMATTQNKPTGEMLEEIVDAQLLTGLMVPADLVSMYLFLCSDAASNITGQAYTVDRGELLS